MSNLNISTHDRVIVINATNIGKTLSGIGVYTLSLIRELIHLKPNFNIILILNRNSKHHFQQFDFSNTFKVIWVSRYISPEFGFFGHLLRLIYSNIISLRYLKFVLFNTSQLEAAFFRPRQILTIHDIIPLIYKQLFPKQFYYYKYLLKLALKSSFIIVPTKHTHDLLTSIYAVKEDNIAIINYGIQNNFIEEGIASEHDREKLILYVGRISETKNIKGLLEAFGLVKNRIEHKLVFVGSGAIPRGLPVDDERVQFKGYVSNEELLVLYKSASLFVFPSFYEGFGFPPLEAMANGCPVVVSNSSSLPEVCGDAAYYVDPYDIESISEGIYTVLTDESLRQSLIKKGFERVKLFNWEKAAREHLSVFEKVIRKDQKKP